jgi:hypothetical protein
MTYRFPNGTEVSDSLFRRIERIVYRVPYWYNKC